MDLVRFYQGEAPDYQGRMLYDIWSWDFGRLEERHDFIQVLFPLDEPSRFNPQAPLFDPATLEKFRDDFEIRQNLFRSFQVMLAFYGFRWDEEQRAVVPAKDFIERAEQWLWPGDHNHLRITRILKCLVLCGMEEEASAFLKDLLAATDPKRVTAETIAYWRSAVPNR